MYVKVSLDSDKITHTWCHFRNRSGEGCISLHTCHYMLVYLLDFVQTNLKTLCSTSMITLDWFQDLKY